MVYVLFLKKENLNFPLIEVFEDKRNALERLATYNSSITDTYNITIEDLEKIAHSFKDCIVEAEFYPKMPFSEDLTL